MSEENLIDVAGLGAESFEPAPPDPLGSNLARAHLSPIANRVQNVNLADSIGSTLDYASVNRADIMRRRALEAIDPQAIRAQTPAFAEWAAKDEANAVMSVNDMGWFQSAEHILKSAANEFEVGVASSEASRLDAYEALARLTGTPGLNEADKARLASLRSGIDSAGSYSGTGGIFSDAIISAAQIAPSLLDVVAQTAKGGAVGAGVGSLAGSVVPGVGTIAGLISGATTGASAGAIESSAMQNFGSMVREFSQLKDENGNLIDQNTADIAAAIATLPVAALDRFSNGKMTALIPDILNIKEQLARYGLRNAVKIPTVRSALMRGARDYATSVGTEAVTEGLQQGIQATARYFASPDANKQFDAASIMAEMGSAVYQAGLGTAVIGIPGGAINTRNMVRGVRAGEHDPEVIAQRTASLHEHMQSKTGQESLNTSAPRLRDFMKSADGGAQVFIDPKPMQELFQSLPDDTRKVLLDALPGFQGQLEEAAAADTDIIMRRGDYAALFASQPWSEPLIPHVRENQLDVSAAELKALIENKDVQNDIDQAASMERLETRLQRRLQDSIQNAGVTPAIASDNSRLLERFIGRTDRLRSLAGETGDISAKLERALSFRRSASEYTQPERVDELTQHLTNIKARMTTEKAPARVSRKNFPVLNYIVKTAGGIDPSGSFGRELAAQDVTPKTHPWIFKTGGVGEIDALDATSLNNAFPKLNLGTSELGKYSVNDLHEIIRQELKNPSVNKEDTARSAAEDNLMSLLDEGLGLSLKEIEAMTPDNLRALLAEYEAGGRSEDSNQFDQAANGKTPYTEPTITVDGKDRPTTNSNGKPIAATKEGLENFWRWFSESRVTDAEGKPLVVYHGTRQDFDSFDFDKVGNRANNKAYFFTNSYHVASAYSVRFGTKRDGSDIRDRYDALAAELEKQGFRQHNIHQTPEWKSLDQDARIDGSNVLPVYLSIKTPAVFDGKNRYLVESKDDPELVSTVKSSGVDGYHMPEVIDAPRTYNEKDRLDARLPNDVWVAFSPNQIKSATGNNGNFSREDNNILHQAANPDASPWYYSQVQRVVEGLKQGKATAEQWLKTIQNTPGVKQEELDWMGLPEWLAKQDGPVTKAALVEFIAANQITVEEVVKGGVSNLSIKEEDGRYVIYDDNGYEVGSEDTEAAATSLMREMADNGEVLNDNTKFGQYVLPGGENYRELLMTLPQQPKRETWEWFDPETQESQQGFATQQEALDARLRISAVVSKVETRDSPQDYRSAHFPEKNIVAHLRFNERTGADGKRVLFIEEIQSDWHQAGRDKGYKGKKSAAALNAKTVREIEGGGGFEVLVDGSVYDVFKTQEEAESFNPPVLENIKAVPDAPFKTTWPELAFKRALRWAVDNGFDRVAWTTGEQQADRYDLSKQVDEIGYSLKNGNVIATKDGKIVVKKDGVKPDNLAEIVGKDVAEKLLSKTPEQDDGFVYASGVDLKVGGEGMRTFYDKMLPSMANKLTKKWGGKVGETSFKGKFIKDENNTVTNATINRAAEMAGNDGKEREAEALKKAALGSVDDVPHQVMMSPYIDLALTEQAATAKVHSLDITPEMKDAAKAGLALFQESRGSISFDTMLEKVVISLSSGANLSTMLHEFGHYASLLHRQTAQIARDALAAGKVTDPAARAELEHVIKDWDTLKEKLGVVGDTLTVDQEEQIAKWFEQYLREGRSPSAELNDIFATFKSWMLQIYKTIKDLGKPINDDVRQVFDRWIASDEEIKAAQSVNLQIEQIAAQFDMLDATGLSKEQAEARAAVGAKVARLINKSGNRASEALLAEVLKEESKKQTEEYKADYAKTLEEVTKAADESRVYAAQDHIKAGHQMDAKLVEQVVGKDIAKRLPNGLRGGKSSPDLIAMQFGYIDGAEMIREIVSNVPKKVFIAQETERLMQARHGNMLEDGRAAERARVLVANDEVGEAIELLVKTAGEKKQTRRLVKAAARQRMLNTRYTDITPGKYSAARDKALRAAYAAGTKAKGGDAAQHLWKAMLNHELLMAANQAKADQAKAQKLYDKINKKDTKLPDSWDAEYVYFARYLLANAGLSTNKGFNPNKWLVDAQERNPELMGQLAEAYKDFMPEKNWKSMTALELSSLHMVVQNIIHIGRENKAFVRAGEKTTIENALSEIVQSLQSQGYSTVQPPLPSSMTMGAKAAKVLYDMEGSLVRIEALCKHLDGGNSFGPMSQSIYRPISDAVNRGKPISNAFITKLAKVMAEREAEYSSSGSIAAPELFSEHFNGVFRNKWDVIACLLNYGNASSATKLIDGYKWNEADLLGVFNKHINARDVEFVQRIWDVLNEVKPYVKEEYYQRTGLSLVEIEPRAFDLHGQTWRGGYYPAAYSREHVANSKIGERADLDQSLFGAEGSSWPAPNKGSSIERTGYVGPIDLNPMVSIRHVEQSIHRWAVAKDIRQTARLVNRPEFQSAMAAINPSYRGLFMPWLRAVARDTVDDAAMTSWDKAAKILRNRATVMIMGLNLRNAMQNLSGYPIVSREIGGKYFMEGMAAYAENPQAATDFIFERSAEMKMRYQNLDREQQEVLRDIAAGKKTAIGKLNSKIQPYAFALSNATDALVSRPAWLGAYKKAKAENKSDADAAYYADSVVRLNVGIGNVKDVAALQRGNQFARTTLVMFYSYMNMVYNLNRSEFLNLKRTGASGIPSFLAGQMLVNIIPNLIAAGIVDALGGGGAGADDEDWMWWYSRRVFSGMFGLVPIVGDFGELIIDEATNEKFFDRFQNPVFSMLGTIGSAVIGDGEAFFQEDPNYSQVVKTTITAMAGTFGTPINDLRHPLGTLADWAEGDSEPVGVWQAVQQLMGAPPPKD